MTRLVIHVGPLDAGAGGIGQVAHRMVAWPDQAFEQRLVTTTRGRGLHHDVGPWLRAASALVRSRRRPALLHAHLSQGGSFVREALLVLLARMLGTPAVVHLHGSGFVAYADRHPRLVGAVLRRAAVVFCLTGATEQRARALLGGRGRVVRVFNADEAVTGPLAPVESAVVFGGVVGRRKGVDVLLAAWDASTRGPGWVLEVHGPPDERSEAVEVPTGADVTAFGSTPHPELMSRLEHSAIAVLPSRAEAFPAFLVEAMARGAVPVASDVGDVRRLVGSAGRVVPVDDAAALAAALSELMAVDDATMASLREAARDRVATEFSPRRLQQIFEEEWARCLT